MRILVTGGRHYNNPAEVARAMGAVIGDAPKHDVIVIHGKALGADTLAGEWARTNGYHVAEVPALWKLWPMTAGPKRNSAMLLLEPDVLVAFPGGRGTADMVMQARKHNVLVYQCEV